MTREQQERIAREILEWKVRDAPLDDPRDYAVFINPETEWFARCADEDPRWLWPLETALMERGWVFSRAPDDSWLGRKSYGIEKLPDILWEDAHAKAVNAAALIELAANSSDD